MRREEAKELLRWAAAHAEQRAASESYDVESALTRFEREIRPEQAAGSGQDQSIVAGAVRIAPAGDKAAVRAPRPKKPHPAPVMLSRRRFAFGSVVGIVSALIAAALIFIPQVSRPAQSVGLPPPSYGSSTYPDMTETPPGASAAPDQTGAPDTTAPTPPQLSSINPHAYYMIENAGTGSCLSYDFVSLLAGPDSCGSGAETDGWQYYMRQPDGTFQLMNEFGGYCLGEQSVTGGAPMVEPCDEVPDQQWRLGYANSKGTSFVNVESGLCLAAGGPSGAGAIELEPCDKQPNELWLNNDTN